MKRACSSDARGGGAARTPARDGVADVCDPAPVREAGPPDVSDRMGDKEQWEGSMPDEKSIIDQLKEKAVEMGHKVIETLDEIAADEDPPKFEVPDHNQTPDKPK